MAKRFGGDFSWILVALNKHPSPLIIALSLFALFLITCYFHSEFCPTQPLIKQGILQARETTRSITEERVSMVAQAREARTDGQRNQEVEEEAC